MHVNKVSRVRTIDRVAKNLSEDVDFLFDVAIEMEPEDRPHLGPGPRRRKRHGLHRRRVDSLVELIKIHPETTPHEQR